MVERPPVRKCRKRGASRTDYGAAAASLPWDGALRVTIDHESESKRPWHDVAQDKGVWEALETHFVSRVLSQLRSDLAVFSLLPLLSFPLCGAGPRPLHRCPLPALSSAPPLARPPPSPRAPAPPSLRPGSPYNAPSSPACRGVRFIPATRRLQRGRLRVIRCARSYRICHVRKCRHLFPLTAWGTSRPHRKS